MVMRCGEMAVSAASDYLQQLLLKPGGYRQSWEQYVSRERRGTINQLAVAEVIARHLWSAPRSPADARSLRTS